MKWEDICSRCGLCCHEKVIFPEALVIDLSAPCEFYDEKSHSCTVYEHRFESCSRCEKVTPFMAAFGSSLPESCAYVKWAAAHHIRFAKKRELVLAEGAS